MGTFFEEHLKLDQAELVDWLLKIQTESYGFLDVPILTNLIKNHTVKTVLDIGSGDGSFLLRLAKENAETSFVGIDHNEHFIENAIFLKEKSGITNVDFNKCFWGKDIHSDNYDMIFTRCTLQHCSEIEIFLDEVLKKLNPNGIFVAIEPVYDYYDCSVTDPVWRGYREKLLSSYEKFGSNPNVPKSIAQKLNVAGFKNIQIPISIYSPVTIGYERFRSVVLATSALLYKVHPEIWEKKFLDELEEWFDELIQSKRLDPFIAIAHTVAYK